MYNLNIYRSRTLSSIYYLSLSRLSSASPNIVSAEDTSSIYLFKLHAKRALHELVYLLKINIENSQISPFLHIPQMSIFGQIEFFTISCNLAIKQCYLRTLEVMAPGPLCPIN